MNEELERLSIGLKELTPLARERLLNKMQEDQPMAAVLLKRVYAGEQITVIEKEELLTALEVHSDGVIRWLREWNTRTSQESDMQADQFRNEPSAERRGGRKPDLDDYDAQRNREDQPDKYRFGRHNR